jgi:hypothetical protein
MESYKDINVRVTYLLQQANIIEPTEYTEDYKCWDDKISTLVIEGHDSSSCPNPFEREQAAFIMYRKGYPVHYTLESMEQYIKAWEVENTVWRVYGEKYQATQANPVVCTEAFLYGPDAGLLMGNLKGQQCDAAFAHAVRLLGNVGPNKWARNSAGERKGLRAADVVMISKHINFHPSTSMHSWVMKGGIVRKPSVDVIEAWVTRDGKEWDHLSPDHDFFQGCHPTLHDYEDGFKYLDDRDSETNLESMSEPSCDSVGSNNYQ